MQGGKNEMDQKTEKQEEDLERKIKKFHKYAEVAKVLGKKYAAAKFQRTVFHLDAELFEMRKSYAMAGRFYTLAREYKEAVRIYEVGIDEISRKYLIRELYLLEKNLQSDYGIWEKAKLKEMNK